MKTTFRGFAYVSPIKKKQMLLWKYPTLLFVFLLSYSLVFSNNYVDSLSMLELSNASDQIQLEKIKSWSQKLHSKSDIEDIILLSAKGLSLAQKLNLSNEALFFEQRQKAVEEFQNIFPHPQTSIFLESTNAQPNSSDYEAIKGRENILLVLLAILLCISLGKHFHSHYQSKSQQQSIVKKIKLQEAEIRSLRHERQKNSYSLLFEGQELERKRLAKELNDELGGVLISAKAYLNQIPMVEAYMPIQQKCNFIIDKACSEVRRIAQNMMPRALAIAGLKEALEDFVALQNKKQLNCTLEILGLEEKLPKTLSLMIFRIVQELFNNIIKHAKANHVLLQVIVHNKGLNLIIEDDGIGFNLMQAEAQKGLGIKNIESRIRFLEGKIEWDTQPGRGSMVLIHIPLKKLKPPQKEYHSVYSLVHEELRFG